jgi:hypothetical protein
LKELKEIIIVRYKENFTKNEFEIFLSARKEENDKNLLHNAFKKWFDDELIQILLKEQVNNLGLIETKKQLRDKTKIGESPLTFATRNENKKVFETLTMTN